MKTYPALVSPEQQFHWPGLGTRYQQMQPFEAWTNNPLGNANSNVYSDNNQQPFFTTPDFDQSRMTWPRNDSYYSTQDNIGHDPRMQYFNGTQSKDAGAPSEIAMVPRNSNAPLSTRITAPGRGRVADT
jgi:hypothetical protein